MKKFEYEISIAGEKQEDADKKVKAFIKIAPRLSPEEWEKMAEVISNPAQLALIKLKLGV